MNDPLAPPAPEKRKRGRPRKQPPPVVGSHPGAPSVGPPDFDPLGHQTALLNSARQPAATPSDLTPYDSIDTRRIDTTSTDFDLTVTDDDLLSEQDLVTHRRLNYVISLLRLQHFLRRQPISFAEEFAQSKLAVKVVSDTEARELELHQYGRQTGDHRLADQIATLRSQLSSLADKRARLKAKVIDAPSEEESPSGS